MKDLLSRCYYDGMTVTEAVDFISRCYGEAPTAKQVEKTQAIIKSCNGQDWK